MCVWLKEILWQRYNRADLAALRDVVDDVLIFWHAENAFEKHDPETPAWLEKLKAAFDE